MNAPLRLLRLDRERGVALVTAMLLMVIGVLVAARLAWDSQLHVRRATTATDMAQARLFALGAESIAIAAIREDSKDNLGATSKPTHEANVGELLMRIDIPVGIEDVNLGMMVGKLDDLQGRLNLNNLLEVDGITPNTVVRDQLSQLVDNLLLDQGLVDAIIDWMDTDTQPLQRGAEDGIYTALDPPYRSANRYFTHVSELRAVAGIDDEIYRKLRKYVTVLPRGGCSAGTSGGFPAVNLNFAEEELLAALDVNVNSSITASWAEMAETSGIIDWAEIDLTALPASFQDLQSAGYVSLATHCFGLTVYVSIGSSVLSMYSVLERSGSAGDNVYVRQRIFGIENPD